MSAVEILAQIRKLSKDEQIDLFEHLRDELDMVDEDLTPEQAAELDRRAEELLKNPETGIPWETVKAEAKERLKNR